MLSEAAPTERLVAPTIPTAPFESLGSASSGGVLSKGTQGTSIAKRGIVSHKRVERVDWL